MKFKNNILLCFIVFVLCACKKPILLPTNPSSSISLANTKWVMYRYKDASMSNPLLRNDTLFFFTDKNYLWNKTNDSYYLIDNNSGVLHLTLNGTSFGNISGNVPTNFTNNKEIVGASFLPLIAGNTQTYTLWFKQIN